MRLPHLIRAVAAVFALAVLTLSVATTLSRLTHHQLVIVTGGSMEPAIRAGDGLLVRQVPTAGLRAGDVVTYRSARGPLTTHRIVALRDVDDQPYLQTKGDANRTPDPDFTPLGAVLGTPVLVVPQGRWLQWVLTTPRGHLSLFGPLLVAVLLHELTVLNTRRRRPPTRAGANIAAPAPLVACDTQGPSDPEAGQHSSPVAETSLPQSAAAHGRAGARVGSVAATVALAGLAAVAAPTASGAAYLDAVSSSGNAVSTAALAPPTNLTGATGSGGDVSLSWTATTSTAATGYQVLRGPGSGGPYTQLATLNSAATTSYTDTTAPGTSYYVLRSTAASWTSANSNQVTAGSTTATTPLTSCTSQQADTGGNNNGYELTPLKGCTRDGATAQDAKTGSNRTVSCTDPGKDRHRYANYSLPVPTNARTVTGLSVQLTANVSTGSGTSRICVQLSGDGGATWTTPKTIPTVATTLTTYQLGSSSDLWGAGWTPGQLSNTNFRVRVINVDDTGNKNFFLDGLAVRATYTN